MSVKFDAADSGVDAVYTWVDGSRADYLQLLEKYSTVPRDLNPERYRDSFSLLKYSLRSLETYAPWIRNVYLFTCRPQVPDWLRRDHPKLRIVHHDEVMPNDGTLPAFNSNVIESYLHLIPGISKQFLYLNDDYLLGGPVARCDFYQKDGRLKVFGTLIGEHFRSRVYEYHAFSFGLLEHGPILVDRDAWAASMATAQIELAEQCVRRFRSPKDVRPERLYRWYLLTHCRTEAVAEPFWRYLAHSSFHKIKAGVVRQRAGLTRIARRRPKFICLNDDLRSNPDPEVVDYVKEFLAGYYPGRSSFEIMNR